MLSWRLIDFSLLTFLMYKRISTQLSAPSSVHSATDLEEPREEPRPAHNADYLGLARRYALGGSFLLLILSFAWTTASGLRTVKGVFVSTRVLLSNVWFQPGPAALHSKWGNPFVAPPGLKERILKEFVGSSEEYTLHHDVPKTVPKVARTTHRFAGDKTFRVKGEEDLKGPDSANKITPENAPHIVHLVLEGVRVKDLQHDFDGFSPTPTARDLRRRGIEWTSIYSQNFHTPSGYEPFYWGTFAQSHNVTDAELRPYAYISHLTRALNYTAVGVTNWYGSELTLQGFQNYKFLWKVGAITPYRETNGELLDFALKQFTKLVEPDERPVFFELRPEASHVPFPGLQYAQRDIPEEYAEFERRFKKKADGLLWRQFTSVWVCDRFFGQFLNALQQMTFKRPVLVVLAADHGYTAGEHGKVAQTLYDLQFHMPLIIADLTDDKSRAILNPDDWNKKITDRLGSNVDIFPTIFDLLGVKEFDTVGCGRSLRRVHPEPIQKNWSVFQNVNGHILRIYNPNAEPAADKCDLSKAKFAKFLLTEPRGRLPLIQGWNLEADPSEDTVCFTSVGQSLPFHQAVKEDFEFYNSVRRFYLSGTVWD